MRAVFDAIFQRILGITALGLIFATGSEIWFYPVDLTPELWVLILAYGLCAWSAVSLIGWAGRWDRAGWWLAAGWIGLLAEGIVVGELYAVPVFNIVWTSLAWHALLTIHIGFIWLLPVLDSPRRAAILSAAFGTGLGLWNAWIWHVPDKGTDFVWGDPGRFVIQVWAGWVLFATGHWIWSRVRIQSLSLKWDAILLAGLCGVIWTTGWALPFFPTSLTLPLLCGLTVVAVFRGASSVPVPAPRPQPRGLAATALIPAAATLSFLAIWAAEINWEVNAVAIVILGPISVWFWGRALINGLRHR